MQEFVSVARSRADWAANTWFGLQTHVSQLVSWLHAFLDQSDRDSLAQLSVFPDAFSAAEAAAMLVPTSGNAERGGRGSSQQEGLDDLLDRLCDLSVIRRLPDPPVETPGGARYIMHVMHRAAAQQLRTDGTLLHNVRE